MDLYRVNSVSWIFSLYPFVQLPSDTRLDSMHHNAAKLPQSSSSKAPKGLKSRQLPSRKLKPKTKAISHRKFATSPTDLSSSTPSSQATPEVLAHVQALCKRQAVLSTTIQLLPTTQRKSLTTPYPLNPTQPSSQPAQVSTSGTNSTNSSNPHAIDLFKVQDTANKLSKHAHQISLTSAEGMTVSQIVQETVLDNIAPLQASLLHRNRTITSSIPGAAFNNQYIHVPSSNSTLHPNVNTNSIVNSIASLSNTNISMNASQSNHTTNPNINQQQQSPPQQQQQQQDRKCLRSGTLLKCSCNHSKE